MESSMLRSSSCRNVQLVALFSATERHAEVSELQRQSTERFNVTSRKAHLLPGEDDLLRGCFV